MAYQSFTDRMTVTVPEGEIDGLAVQRFTMERYDLENMRQALHYGRGTRPGEYTRLIDRKTGTFWMSDTDAEKSDHHKPVAMINFLKAQRVVINGLGLGMVLQAALTFAHVEHIDVVEQDARVIRLVGPHYTQDPRVNIIHADAYEQVKVWPRGTRWDVGWSDVWPEITTDDRDTRRFLHTRYARRTQWHGNWAQDMVNRTYRAERAEERRHAEWWS
jgi:hypothetical protein